MLSLTALLPNTQATEIREAEGIIEDRIESVIPASLCAFSLGVNLFDLHI